jgi:hypothetical protein
MGGQSFTMSQKYIKSRCRVWGIWPLNLVAMVGKINPIEVFIATKDEDHENAYPFFNVIDQVRGIRNEVLTITNLLNIIWIFHAMCTSILHMIEGPFSFGLRRLNIRFTSKQQKNV